MEIRISSPGWRSVIKTRYLGVFAFSCVIFGGDVD